MLRKLVFTDFAQEDLAEIASHIFDQSGDVEVAQAFDRKLRDRCERLANLPGTLGTERPELRLDIRSTPIGNYVIFFRHRDDMFEVVNVLDGHRDIKAHFDA